MKKQLAFLSCFLVFVYLFSCQKEKPLSVYNFSYRYGNIVAKVNGVDFSGRVSVTNGDAIISDVSTANVKFNKAGEENPIWKFSILNTRKMSGMQKIYGTDYSGKNPALLQAVLFHFDGYWDASCGDYQTIDADSSSNYIEITDQKDNYHEIWGRFNVTLYIASQCKYNPMPDTISITDGSFHLFPPDKK